MLPHWDFWSKARKSLMDYALAISYAAGVGFAITPILPASGTGVGGTARPGRKIHGPSDSHGEV